MDRLYLDDLRDGSATATWQLKEPVDRMTFVRYAGASGDFNPIHLDDEVARAAGYPSVFGQGLFSAGLLGHFATDWLGVGRVTALRVRFKRQLFPGDLLTCAGEVTGSRDDIVDVRLVLTNQRGDVLVEGSATAAPARRGEADTGEGDPGGNA